MITREEFSNLTLRIKDQFGTVPTSHIRFDELYLKEEYQSINDCNILSESLQKDVNYVKDDFEAYNIEFKFKITFEIIAKQRCD